MGGKEETLAGLSGMGDLLLLPVIQKLLAITL